MRPLTINPIKAPAIRVSFNGVKNMKKLSLLFLALFLVLGALPAITKADATSTPKTNKGKNKVTAQVDMTCVKNALVIRETAIATAYTKHTTAINAALVKRQTDLTAAWGKTVVKERRAAIKRAWNDFNKAKKTANQEYKTANRAAWKTFRDAAKVCKINSVSDEPSGFNMGERGDSSLD